MTDPNLPEQPAGAVPPVPPAPRPASAAGPPARRCPAYNAPAAPAYGETATPARYGQRRRLRPARHRAPRRPTSSPSSRWSRRSSCSLVAIITGHIALSQIKKTGEQGRGLAIAGLIIGYIGFVIGLIVIIFWAIALATIAANPDLVVN